MHLYGAPPGAVTSVPVIETATSLQCGRPEKLFDVRLPRALDVSQDGQRFLLAIVTDTSKTDAPLSLVLDWPALLKR